MDLVELGLGALFLSIACLIGSIAYKTVVEPPTQTYKCTIVTSPK